jgi:hypothetical protein
MYGLNKALSWVSPRSILLMMVVSLGEHFSTLLRGWELHSRYISVMHYYHSRKAHIKCRLAGLPVTMLPTTPLCFVTLGGVSTNTSLKWESLSGIPRHVILG